METRDRTVPTIAFKLGLLLAATISGHAAPWVERAAGREVGRAGGFTLEPDPLLRRTGLQGGNRRNQRARVGMAGCVKQFVRPAHFDDSAQVHHGYPIAQVPHDR